MHDCAPLIGSTQSAFADLAGDHEGARAVTTNMRNLNTLELARGALHFKVYAAAASGKGKRQGGFRACSAGLKNTVPADCCERKILFWHDVNSVFVRWLASRQPASQPAEHSLNLRRSTACSLVDFWAGLSWLVLVYCERKTLLAGWFGLVETNKRTG